MMSKVDLTNGAFSPADAEGRWMALQARFKEVCASVSAPVASRTAAGCSLAFWSEGAAFTVTAAQADVLIGYLVVLRKGRCLLAGDVAVKKLHRRAGIATAMYDFAEEQLGAEFEACVPHTVHAAAFWSDRARRVVSALR
ncbi:GNAT family N-acetyltransferase [Burkholderia ambifaria]|uniref:GNAT family N-acetyltransferase n=1 Tax=Burkholderia ambifaria TaxID=152480 RepID=UPI002FE26552